MTFDGDQYMVSYDPGDGSPLQHLGSFATLYYARKGLLGAAACSAQGFVVLTGPGFKWTKACDQSVPRH